LKKTKKDKAGEQEEEKEEEDPCFNPTKLSIIKSRMEYG